VYVYASKVAVALNCPTIIDLGCGTGRKLGPLAEAFNVIGIDYGSNIAAAAKHPYGSWREHDLSVDTALPVSNEEAARAVFIAADVAEHLVDPWLMLRRLAEAMGDAGVALISTPERELTHGDIHGGPPTNPAHVREWSIRELDLMLEDAGFAGRSLGLTRSTDRAPYLHTILAIVARDQSRARIAAEAVIDATPAQPGARRQMTLATALRRAHATLVRRF
jgi:SAM-dependent methyltransferase